MTNQRERLLVNFFYAPPVGHAVEALHYCLGHHAADPTREVSVVLNRASAVELPSFCPFVTNVYAIEQPLTEPCVDPEVRQTAIPRSWDWIVDDFRRGQELQLEMFPGLRSYYRASDRRLAARRGRTFVGSAEAGYVPHTQLRFELPASARAAAARRLGDPSSGLRRIAIMPAGSAEYSRYPSAGSWLVILDALSDTFPGIQIALVGKRKRDGRTTTSIADADLALLLAHRSRPVACVDIELAEQLAVVEACDLFFAPHTGFGMAALAVGTPWLALSGGRWFEYFFNHVPFRSVIPDCERYPSFTQFTAGALLDDEGNGRRTPSMSAARIREDLGRIVAAAEDLLSGALTYEQALRDYFSDLVAAHGGKAGAIWSIDGVHFGYLP